MRSLPRARSLQPRVSAAVALGLSLIICLLAPSMILAQAVRVVRPSPAAVSTSDRILVAVLGEPGARISLKVNGRDERTGKVRPDGVAEFINVAVVPGPNSLEVIQTAGDGSKSRDTARVHVVGPPVTIRLKLTPYQLPADGSSRAQAEVFVSDAWGLAVSDDWVATLALDAGNIASEDVDPARPGTQLRLWAGKAVATIVSDTRAGSASLVVDCDGASERIRIRYLPLSEPLVIVGLTGGEWGSRRTLNPGQNLASARPFHEGRYSQGRAAVFARGTVVERFLLTASYDSDRRQQDRVFRMLTPDLVYPVYGDASILSYEAPSASRLFAKIERDNSHVLFGDFTTAPPPLQGRGHGVLPPALELAAYNRTLTGLQSQVGTDRVGFAGFGSRTDRHIVADQIAGQGMSGYYYLSSRPVIERSERIVIQTRDKYHPESILHEDALSRYNDYDIEYQDGAILFKEPVSSRDVADNPVIIVASYEAAGGGDGQYVAGGSFRLLAGDATTFGAMAVEEERPGQNYRLLGMDGHLNVARRITIGGEAAQSSGASGEGLAWKGEVAGTLGANLTADGYFRRIGKEFLNESSVTARPGTEKYRACLGWSPSGRAKMEVEHYRLSDNISNQRESSVSSRAEGRFWRLDVATGFERFNKRDLVRDEEATSMIASGRLKAELSRRASLSVARQQNLGDRNLSYKPTSTTLGADYKIAENASIVARHEMFKQSILDSSLSTIGIESRIGGDFTAYSNYHISGGMEGRSNQASIGLRNRLQISRLLTLNLGHERTKTIGGSAFDVSSYSFGLEILPSSPWKTAARYEQRRGRDSRRHLATFGTDGRLAGGLALILKDSYSADNTRTSGFWEDNLRNKLVVGLAYRPPRQDLLQLLSKAEYTYENREVANPTTVSNLLMGSMEGVFQPHRKARMFGRYAIKALNEKSLGSVATTLTDLWMTRLSYDIVRSVDLSAEYRLLAQRQANDARTGWALEAGWNAVKNIRVAAGYNFEGYDDRDLADGDYWSRGPYAKLQLKFTEHTLADAAGLALGHRL